MKSIQNIAASFFIVATAVLTLVSILGVWDFFSENVIWKSFQTIGLLALVAAIIMVAGRHINGGSDVALESQIPHPVFKSIRVITLTILIVSVSILALLGVLAIWDVVESTDILGKSLGSLAILAFGSLVIVATCSSMEGKTFKPKTSPVVTYTVKQE